MNQSRQFKEPRTNHGQVTLVLASQDPNSCTSSGLQNFKRTMLKSFLLIIVLSVPVVFATAPQVEIAPASQDVQNETNTTGPPTQTEAPHVVGPNNEDDSPQYEEMLEHAPNDIIGLIGQY